MRQMKVLGKLRLKDAARGSIPLFCLEDMNLPDRKETLASYLVDVCSINVGSNTRWM